MVEEILPHREEKERATQAEEAMKARDGGPLAEGQSGT